MWLIAVFFRSSHYYWLVVQTPLLSHWDFIVVVFQVNTKNSYCIAALCCNKKNCATCALRKKDLQLIMANYFLAKAKVT